MKGNIVITTSSFGEYETRPLDILKKAGYDYMLNPYGRKVKKDELLNLIDGAEGLIAGIEEIDSEILDKMSNIKVISRCGAGLDSIDLQKALEVGIKVYNTPDAPTKPVAELTLGLILSVLRGIPLADRMIREGHWVKQMGGLLYGKKVGIIGLGRIGSAVADLLKPFETDLYYYDLAKAQLSNKIKFLELDELLRTVDIVTLHVPLSEKTLNLINEERLDFMKKGSILINCSRGGIIDEDALYRKLKSDHLAGAAIDVFEREPYQGPLRELDNVILTPHIGSYGKEARIQMECESVQNLIKGLEGTI